MIVKIKKGCLYGIIENIDKKYLENIPNDYKINQENRDNNKYHITIIQSEEFKNHDYLEKEVNIKYFNLGLSKLQKDKNEVYYLYIYSNDLNDIRKQFNLEPKTFHITLGFKFNDIHDKDKSLNNIFIKNIDLIENEIIPCVNNDEINNYLKSNYFCPKILVKELRKDCVKYQQNIINLIDNNNYLGYIFRYQISNNIEDLELAIDNYDHKIQIKYDPTNIGTINCIKKINQEIMKNKLEHRKQLYYYCQKSNKIILHDMPRNFSWIIENKIGGISKLKNEIDIIILQSLGIKKIYYFLEKSYFDDIDSKDIQINYVHCINEMPPTIEDMLTTLQNEDFNQPVLFGCLGGYGRTGTALACYLCHDSYFNNNNMNSERAITFLRSIRPKSIETDIQYNFVKQYYNHLFKLDTTSLPIPIKIKTPIKFIMLVGLPGSGKSTFTELFMTNDMNIKVVNQDIMGRSSCESALLKFIKDSDITILDRVNSTKKDRKSWIDNASLPPKNCLCIYLSTPKFICLDRAKNRTNHPTIKKGGGQRIITDLDNNFEVPTIDEGFSNIIILEDEEDVRDYLKTWKCTKIEIEDTNFIHKFPRTQHIFNIGGASVDDRILSTFDYDQIMNDNNVFIAEKVDGAQLGISLDENYKIIIQNRSHYVNSKSHSQFEKLDKWVLDHSDALYGILDNDTILFGEWLYAKHSIAYNNLPDYFLAFDLYNKKKKLFYNRNILVDKLKDTTINYVREMYIGKIKDRNQLLKMIEEKSNYTDGSVEGIYLKIFEGDYIKSRCKLVRNDFISGNDHWAKYNIQKNTLNINI